MIELIIILVFISLYGLSSLGEKRGMRFFLSAFLIHLGYIGYRAWFLGRLPVTERHDILLVIAAGVACGLLLFRRSMPVSSLLNVLPIFAVIFCFFGLFQERMDTIEPNMNTPWFPAYMILFMGGYVFLTLGSATGVLFLLERDVAYERAQHRMILLGWLLFSFSLVAGSVWFYRVHGVYWLWTAKELWTTVTWFFFSFYLHARLMKSLRGRPAALIGVLGFVVMLFSYLGVTPILGSPWTQF